MKHLVLNFLLVLLPAGLVFAQIPIQSAGSSITISFDGPIGNTVEGEIQGTGFHPDPATSTTPGQFDSDAFRVSGFSDGSLVFGGTVTGTDGSHQLYRGVTAAAVTVPGIYAYNSTASPVTNLPANTVPGTQAGTAGGRLVLIQPSSTEFNNNGELVLRAVNNTGGVIDNLNLSADVCVRNDTDNESTYALQYATADADASYQEVFAQPTGGAAAGTTIPGGPTLFFVACANTGPQNLSNLNLAPNEFLYIRILANDTGTPVGTDRDEVYVDNITLSDVVLPVEMTYFHAAAQRDGALLNWETALELNNDYFEVQHSTDGVRFQPIGEVLGAGTTEQTTQYRFLDAAPAAGTNYYRLRQVDFDGTETLTEVVTVEYAGRRPELAAFPNPTAGELTVQFGAETDADARIQVVSAAGRLLLDAPAGHQFQHQIYLTDYPAGVYFVRVVDRNQVRTLSVQKR